MRTYVLDPGARQLSRIWQIAGLRHTRYGDRRAGILQQHKIIRGHVEIGVVDARGQILERGEDDRSAFLFEQVRVGRRALEDRPLRR